MVSQKSQFKAGSGTEQPDFGELSPEPLERRSKGLKQSVPLEVAEFQTNDFSMIQARYHRISQDWIDVLQKKNKEGWMEQGCDANSRLQAS